MAHHYWGTKPKKALEVLTKAVKRENAAKLDLFGGEKNEFPLMPTSLEKLLLGKDPGAVKKVAASIMAWMKPLDSNGKKVVLEKERSYFGRRGWIRRTW